MTPAINLLRKHSVSHQILRYEHDHDAPSYGLEAAEKLGLEISLAPDVLHALTHASFAHITGKE
jgi:prolyl-tRNA editing enzyme YbaK/EbsC (Cys-tRNA(Pro) deacylase)